MTKDRLHHFTLRSRDGLGKTAEIWIDGVKPKGVRKVVYRARVGHVDTVTVTFMAASVNFNDPEPGR